MTHSDDDFPLWSWALERYARPGVADTCLMLQDQFRARVTLLLWLWWLDERKVPLTPSQLDDACRLTAPLEDDLVIPLRRLRRQIRCWGDAEPELEQARERIKAAELLAEKAVLRRLAALSEPWTVAQKKPAATCGGLCAYLAGLGVTPVPPALSARTDNQ